MATQEIHVKQEPIESISPEPQVQPLYTPPSQLQIGVHHRLRNYSRNASSSSPESFVCEVCQVEFLYQDVLHKHKLLHFNTRHVCYSCDCYFINTDTLLMHMSTIHSTSNVASSHTHKGELFVCNICLQRFSSSKILQKHERTHTLKDEGVFACKICAMDFLGYKALLAHLNSPRHRDMKVKIQSIFVCVDCRAIFASRDSYAMHMMVRAQNETCEAKRAQYQLKPSASPIVPKDEPLSYLHLHESNGKFPPPLIDQSTSNPRSPSPLNLSIQAKESLTTEALEISPTTHAPDPLSDLHFRGQHRCPRCREYFSTQDALAMHFMLHAKTEAEDEHETSIKTKLSAAMIARTHALLVGTIMPRTRSLPVIAAPHSFQPYKNQPKWSCTICQRSFESCDTLAMHVMDKHTNGMSGRVFTGQTSASSRKCGGDGLRNRTSPINHLHSSGSDTLIGPLTTDDLLLTTGQKVSDRAQKRCRSMDMMSMNPGEPPTKRCHSADEATQVVFFSRDTTSQIPEIGIEDSRDSSAQDEEAIMGVAAAMGESEERIAVDNAAENDEYLQELQDREGFQGLYERTPLVGGSNGSPVDHHADCTRYTTIDEEKRSIRDGYEVQGTDEVHSSPLSTSLMPGIGRRSKRKPRAVAKFIQPNPSPQPVSSPWDSQLEETNTGEEELAASPRLTPNGRPASQPRHTSMIASFQGNGHMARSGCVSSPPQIGSPRPTPSSVLAGSSPHTVSPDMVEDADLLEYILHHVHTLAMCRFCGIIFTDRTMYYLHMGLHNVNNPWQCNLCGKVCNGVHQFSSHVIHY